MARSIGIRVHKGAELVDTQVFERDIIKIGRLASAHLRLEDPKVSRIHAVIDIAAGGHEVSIIDMGSAEGTRVNGEKVSRVRLKNGDEVGLGDSRLVVVLDEAEIAAMRGAAPMAAADTVVAEVVRAVASPPPLPPMSQEGAAVTTSPNQDLTKLREQLAATAVGGSIAQSPAPVVVPGPPAPAMTAAAPKPAAARRAPPPPPRAAVAMPPLPPIPEDQITSENRFVEVTLSWGHDIVGVKRLRDVPKVVIGSSDTADFFVPLESVASSSNFDVLRSSQGGGWHVRFTQKMNGTVARGANEVPLSQAGGVPDSDAMSIPLTDDTRVTLNIGQFSLQIRPVPRSRFIPLAPIFDLLWANTALVSMFLMATMASVVVLLPIGVDNLDDDLLTNPSKFQTLILKPPPKDNALLKKLAGSKSSEAKAKNKEGKAGDKKLAKTEQGKAAAKKIPDKPTDAQVVANKMDQLFGGKKGGLAAIFGETQGGDALTAALGGIDGAKVAGAGDGSLGVKGGGPGGGGTGTNTFGVGKVGTRGKGSGESGYGAGEGGLGTKGDHEVTMTQGSPMVMGSLDKEIIRRIVQEHASQIRYCYEHELTRTPGIFGKIMMKWVISGEGKVNQSQVAESQMKNSNVEQCIARKIQGWVFPKPKGGGIVVVSYPFVFKQSGG